MGFVTEILPQKIILHLHSDHWTTFKRVKNAAHGFYFWTFASPIPDQRFLLRAAVQFTFHQNAEIKIR